MTQEMKSCAEEHGIKRQQAFAKVYITITRVYNLNFHRHMPSFVSASIKKAHESLIYINIDPPTKHAITTFLETVDTVKRCKGVTLAGNQCRKKQKSFFCKYHSTQIANSIKADNTGLFRKLIGKFNDTCDTADIRLMYIHGSLNTLKYIESEGLDIQKTQENILLAVQYGQMGIIKYLHKHVEESTGLMWYILCACEYDQIDMVKYFMSHSKDKLYLNYGALTRAILGESVRVIWYLFQKGLDVRNVPPLLWEKVCAIHIWEFYKRQRLRKRLWKVMEQIIPIYYNPQAKGGYFSKKAIMGCVE